MKIKNVFMIFIIVLFIITFNISASAEVYSDEKNATIHIELRIPRPDYIKDMITQFSFIVDVNSQCIIYSNYGGTFNKLSETLWVEKEYLYRHYINLTTPGNYTWNVVCKTFRGTNETWAVYENREFTIIPPELELDIINQTENITINITTNITENITLNLTEEVNLTANNTIEEIINLVNNCNGCMSEGSCLNIGHLKESVNKVKYYCSNNHVFELRKNNKEECFDNFECESNYCLNSVCRSKGIFTSILLSFGFY